MRAGDPGGAGRADDPGRAAADEAALRAVIEFCVRSYPDARRDRVEWLVRSSYERTSGATVHQFRVLLAERAALVHLRREARGG
jgi:hypothetical protein